MATSLHQVRRLNLIEAQLVHERNRRLEQFLQAAGIDPEGEPTIELRGEAT